MDRFVGHYDKFAAGLGFFPTFHNSFSLLSRALIALAQH